MTHIAITDSPFSPWQVLADYSDRIRADAAGEAGACATFVGSMRDFNQGDGVSGMSLEHYPGMTERQLEELVAAAVERWHLIDALVIHRVGELKPDEPIVLVAVWSAHRRESFEACRAIMEELKSTAPFWKRELLDSGEQRWVESNSDGY